MTVMIQIDPLVLLRVYLGFTQTMQVIDSSTLDEIATYPMMHSKSRLFRHSETGVTGLDILPGGKLFSCGVDGTVKCRTITL